MHLELISAVVIVACLSLLVMTWTEKTCRASVPVSVNFHFTRKCNKECGFCFHTEKSSHIATDIEMKKGLTMLKRAGMRKINFAGGEPFLYPRKLAMLCLFSKSVLHLESVSIITNGTKVTREWLKTNYRAIDVLGVSCDSFDEDTNTLIGRGTGQNASKLFEIRDWCREFGIKLKLNTVVCQLNWEEDMTFAISALQPFRWKCFQVLIVEAENDATLESTRLDKRKRNARGLVISESQFAQFCEKHKHLDCFIPEPNNVMASSYLILDEYLCFLDKGGWREKQSSSILEVGVTEAMKEVQWDKNAFLKRGGIYDWSREPESNQCAEKLPKEFQF